MRIDDKGTCFEVFSHQQTPCSAIRQGSKASTVHDMLPESAERLLMRLVRTATESGAVKSGEISLGSGTETSTCQVQVVPYARHRALTVIHDVSEQKRTQRALQDALQRIEKLDEQIRTVREEERTNIARDLHDDMGQSLTALKMDLACLSRELCAERGQIQDKFVAMMGNVDSIIHKVQNFSTELRTTPLAVGSLTETIEQQVRNFAARAGIESTCEIANQELELGSDVAYALYRILQEALTNVARHAEASHLRVRLAGGRKWVTLTVLDNGRGVPDSRASCPKHLGVMGMQERARSIGGDASVASGVGGGTCVRVRVPRWQGQEAGAG
ncbi:MAG: sensor histidine kinase [Rhodothermales bacterium]|nr:sensor histidine kinase [Rhodothermales bacterium]